MNRPQGDSRRRGTRTGTRLNLQGESPDAKKTLVADPRVNTEQAKDLGVVLVGLDTTLDGEYCAATVAMAHDRSAGALPAFAPACEGRRCAQGVRGLFGPEVDAWS